MATKVKLWTCSGIRLDSIFNLFSWKKD